MSDPKGTALLVAVTHTVKDEVQRRNIRQPNGGNFAWWPLIADVIQQITGVARSPNRTRNKYREATANLSSEALQALADSVAPETYLGVVRAVLGDGGAEERAPEPLDPHEEALRNFVWAAGLPAGQLPQHEEGAEAPEADEEPTVTPELLQRLWTALITSQDAITAMDTTRPVVEIPIQTDKPWGAVFFSDQHVLGIGVNHKTLEEDMRVWQANRDILGVFDLGDNLDQFLPTKHPSAMMETLARPGVQRAMVKHLWKKYLSEVLKAKVRGNHDAWSSAADYDFASELAQEMGVPFLGDGGRVWLHVGKQTYKLELRHDFLFKSSLNTTNSQRRLFEFALGADVVCFGHLHYPDMHFAWRNGQDVALLRCSSYKETDGYAQAKGLQLGYAPSPPDMPLVIFFPHQHKILPFRSYRDGLPLLKALQA